MSESNCTRLVRELTLEPQPFVEVVPVAESRPAVELTPEQRDGIIVDVIHDGHWLPAELLIDGEGREIPREVFRSEYIAERDWGASCVAERLAARLGLESFARVTIARVLMDFGRFPGSTRRDADHMDRFAINYPFSALLSYPQKKQLLETYYDGVSSALDGCLKGKLIKLAVHTYDARNKSGTERPPMSMMTRSVGYQSESELPSGLFDPLYPDILAEFTADRVLRDRVSLMLEKAGVPVAHNYPYLLPEGSLEVRYQVWAYFHCLRRIFEEAHPETAREPAFRAIWGMLQDTNLRSSESEALRSYLHMYRRAPRHMQDVFARAEAAYERIREFSDGPGRATLDRHRFSAEHTSSIAIEVRKDIVCELDGEGVPRAVRTENVALIADTIADAVAVYLREDRPSCAPVRDELDRHSPWYRDSRRA